MKRAPLAALVLATLALTGGAWALYEEASPGADLAKSATAFVGTLTAEQRAGAVLALGPEAVALKLVRALESPRPKPRYYVAVPTYVAALLRRVLPTRWLDAIAARN